MAACGSLNLNHIFDNPLPDSSPALLESLSPWKHLIKSMNPISESSPSNSVFAASRSGKNGRSPDIFGNNEYPAENGYKVDYSMSSYYQNLSLCTEGLGFESFDDIEGLLRSNDCSCENTCRNKEEGRNYTRKETKAESMENDWSGAKRSETTWKSGGFPPPISCIGRNGKPWVCFKSFRQDGRFILKEIRVPTQEFLQSCRENGRLRLQFVQSDDEDEVSEGKDDEEDDQQNGQEGGAVETASESSKL